MKTKILEITGLSFFVLALLIFFGLGVKYAIERHEQFECYKWQAEANSYPNFYLTQWQAEQCQRWHIKIDAPVKP